MHKWEYEISGIALRELALEKDVTGVLKELKNMTSYIVKKLDPYNSGEFEDLESLIESDLTLTPDELLEFILENTESDSLLEYTDGILEWFYDLCDSARIWVTL